MPSPAGHNAGERQNQYPTNDDQSRGRTSLLVDVSKSGRIVCSAGSRVAGEPRGLFGRDLARLAIEY